MGKYIDLCQQDFMIGHKGQIEAMHDGKNLHLVTHNLDGTVEILFVGDGAEGLGQPLHI